MGKYLSVERPNSSEDLNLLQPVVLTSNFTLLIFFIIRPRLPEVINVFNLNSRYSDSIRAGRSGDRILVGARFSAPVQTGPGAYPASCTMATGFFPGVKRPGRGADHPPPSKSRKSGAIPLHFLWAFMACYGSTLVVSILLCPVNRLSTQSSV